MDEQRILDEIERLLAADDPRFAARLTSFGRSGIRDMFRTRRARALVSALTVAVVAAVVIAFYAMSSIRASSTPGSQVAHRTTTSQSPKSTASVVTHAQLPVTGEHDRP